MCGDGKRTRYPDRPNPQTRTPSPQPMTGFTSVVLHSASRGFHPSQSRLSRWRALAKRIIRRSAKLTELSDEELRKHSGELRWRAKTGARLEQLVPEAFALVREASRRRTGMSQFPVQLMGGIALFEGHVAEMQTGEGKTLTAVAPAYLRGLVGRGCHVITVNDYLAERDAKQMSPIYETLGLSVGVILSEMEPDERRENYAKDITYGTAKEFGFDFLRDRLRKGAAESHLERSRPLGSDVDSGEPPVQRGYYFALIDEADSVLIDEARTPLIIGLTRHNDPANVNLLRWCRLTAAGLKRDEDFVYHEDRRDGRLTDHGCRRVLLMGKPRLIEAIDMERIYEAVEKALVAQYGFQRDRDYVVVDDKIVIVDESTGRTMDGRKWQDGLHQAVEAKERAPITALTGQAARVTVQAFFRLYTHLAGMTGTAVDVRKEMRKIYSLKVCRIPTNRPCIRQQQPPRLFRSLEAKWKAVAEETARVSRMGRAVLIGTPSVEASEALGRMLKSAGISHQVLNARQNAQEAKIVASAGQRGAVTIATNMAGRGTDILLDEQARGTGGLHVIATEMHTASRIDRQLVGRSARQGDPGSYQFFLSLEDELMRHWSPEKPARWLAQAGAREQLDEHWLSRFRKTQRTVERQHRKQRKQMLKQEKDRTMSFAKMGLDPYLELTE